MTTHLLLGCVLYYGVLVFNLTITFWIGETLLGLVGLMIYLPIIILLVLRLFNRVPTPLVSVSSPSSGTLPVHS